MGVGCGELGQGEVVFDPSGGGGYKERKKCGFVLCKHSFCTIREEEVGSNPGKEHTIAIVRPYTALQWVKGKENSSYKKPAGL